MYKRILLPLDGSPLAEQALPHACELAKCFGAELILLRVVEPFAQVRGLSITDLEKIKEQTMTWVGEYLEQIAASIQEGDVSVVMDIVEGNAQVAITQFAEANRVDLIVMSTRGRSGISRWLMGSVADRVMRGATVPVLLVQTGPHGQGNNQVDHF
jgi:nucleotide-binding universal stress UspA family protein